ncbi:MAG: serine/threonine protein kinase [Actinobacteria bacterium]|nr:MAG: serine/threonine protein kinase [Actinomycetota bacterium]
MALDRRIGTELAGYRIVEPLGRGGTSVVYRAEHVRLGRQAALKLLAPVLGEAGFRERFLRESQLAASIDHPSILPVYDAGEEDGFLYIAMACVEGSDLKTLLVEEGRLPLRRALRIVGQIGSALDAAHARGLVHRDVKPANILVGADDRAYLSDFGVVKELASNGTTRTGSFVGTIEYCAPEQIEGRAVDGRADVYALACVLYECLTGGAPFHRPSEVAVLNAHLHAPPPKLPGQPGGLEAVIAKALSKSPLDRYATCAEFLAAARAAAAERRVHPLRLAASLTLLVLAGALGAAAALGIRSLVDADRASVTTIVRPSASLPPRANLDKLLLKSNDGRTLNDAAFALIGAKAYSRALPFARRAVRKTAAGSLTRGYATFNLGYALLELGRCGESLPYLRKALAIEVPSQAPFIRPRIRQAKRCAQRGASGPAPSRS